MDTEQPEPQIPPCPECGSRRVKHFGEWGHDGNPENAWFQCLRCEHQWSDFKLSGALLGLDREQES
jgi:DNA-directed RNA polymerase subunit M/transcription elongation factor TFIIS